MVAGAWVPIFCMQYFSYYKIHKNPCSCVVESTFVSRQFIFFVVLKVVNW
jgi:hypothetical protein